MRIFIAVLLLMSSGAAFGYGPYQADLVRVIDGDTVEVDLALYPGLTKRVSVRVAGIDAPETRTRNLCEKALGLKAEDRVKDLLAGDGPLVVDHIALGKFAGRVVGDISMAGADLASVLLDEGLVRAYSGGARQPWCQ